MTNIAFDTQRQSFYVTLWEDGQRRVRCFATLEDAISALSQHTARQVLAQDQAERLTVGQWLTYWLEQIVRPSKAASTTYGYSKIIRNHLSPALGGILLRQLSAYHVQQYLNDRLAQGLCANTVRRHQNVLHNALEQARRQKLIADNVAEEAARPASIQPVHHYCNAETISRLFKIVEGTSMEPVVKLASYLGLRRSEICGLKWTSVDRRERTITIQEARTAVNGKSVDKDTKTPSSIRCLGYAGQSDLEDLMERLWQRRLREREALGSAYDSRDFVVCHDGGAPYQADYMSNRLQRLLAGKGLPHITLHGLRHSFASIAHHSNVPLLGISRALGHSSTATTTKIYTHLFDETHLAVVQAVGAAIEAEK
jgi:integrase